MLGVRVYHYIHSMAGNAHAQYNASGHEMLMNKAERQINGSTSNKASEGAWRLQNV